MADADTGTRVRIVNPYSVTESPNRLDRRREFVRGFRDRRLARAFFKHCINWASRFHKRRFDLFQMLEIETINRCNNTCPFCPVNRDVDPRPLERMSDDVYKKIIDELGELRYRGQLDFHSNNEPFLDKKLIDRIAYARQRCPEAFFAVCTNGTALNLSRIVSALDAGLDHMTIDNYDDRLVLLDNIALIVSELQKPGYESYCDRLEIILRKKNEVLANRAGNAPNKNLELFKEYETLQDFSCIIPFYQMVIRPTGEVSLCCNDTLGQVTLGDVRTHSLREIWNSPAYEALRAELMANGRRNLKLCQVCDDLMIGREPGVRSVIRLFIRGMIPSRVLLAAKRGTLRRRWRVRD